LEAESDGGDSLPAQPRRGSIQGGLVGTARQQACVDRAARLEELRRQYTELQEEITLGDAAAGERQRSEQETAAAQAAGGITAADRTRLETLAWLSLCEETQVSRQSALVNRLRRRSMDRTGCSAPRSGESAEKVLRAQMSAPRPSSCQTGG